MKTIELQQSILALLLVVIYIWLFITATSKWSYFLGSLITYIAMSLVYTKLKNEYLANMEALQNGRK